MVKLHYLLIVLLAPSLVVMFWAAQSGALEDAGMTHAYNNYRKETARLVEENRHDELAYAYQKWLSKFEQLMAESDPDSEKRLQIMSEMTALYSALGQDERSADLSITVRDEAKKRGYSHLADVHTVSAVGNIYYAKGRGNAQDLLELIEKINISMPAAERLGPLDHLCLLQDKIEIQTRSADYRGALDSLDEFIAHLQSYTEAGFSPSMSMSSLCLTWATQKQAELQIVAAAKDAYLATGHGSKEQLVELLGQLDASMQAAQCLDATVPLYLLQAKMEIQIRNGTYQDALETCHELKSRHQLYNSLVYSEEKCRALFSYQLEPSWWWRQMQIFQPAGVLSDAGNSSWHARLSN